MSSRETSRQRDSSIAYGAGLMRRLFKHGSETEELATSRLVDHHFLLIFVHSEHAHFARDDHVSLRTGVAHFVNALARRECLEFDLACQHGRLFIVQQGKEGNFSKYFRIARH